MRNLFLISLAILWTLFETFAANLPVWPGIPVGVIITVVIYDISLAFYIRKIKQQINVSR